MLGDGMSTVLAGPREAFERFRDMALSGGSAGLESMLADDCVVETPFAPPGSALRFEGREAFATTVAERQRAFFARIRFNDVREVAVHETTDPTTAIVEYEMEAERMSDGFRASAAFVVVIGVRDGRVTLWREYQNPIAMAQVAG